MGTLQGVGSFPVGILAEACRAFQGILVENLAGGPYLGVACSCTRPSQSIMRTSQEQARRGNSGSARYC